MIINFGAIFKDMFYFIKTTSSKEKKAIFAITT